MRLFDPGTRTSSPRNARIYAGYEIAFTAVDFSAAGMFVIGSICFFSSEWQYVGTWLFLIGSIFFALKPTIRIARELHYLRAGRIERLAERANE